MVIFLKLYKYLRQLIFWLKKCSNLETRIIFSSRQFLSSISCFFFFLITVSEETTFNSCNFFLLKVRYDNTSRLCSIQESFYASRSIVDRLRVKTSKSSRSFARDFERVRGSFIADWERNWRSLAESASPFSRATCIAV